LPDFVHSRRPSRHGRVGIGDALTAAGIANRESCFYNRFGQLIYREPRSWGARRRAPTM